MITFFKKGNSTYYAIDSDHTFSDIEAQKLSWLFGGATKLDEDIIKGTFIGPRREMITPWSTNAVEITQNMGRRNTVSEKFGAKIGSTFDRQ